MIRTLLVSRSLERARMSALLVFACVTVAATAQGQSARQDALPWSRTKPTIIKPWFPLLGQRAELPYPTDSTVAQRNTCPMPVAHSQIVDPMPVSGQLPTLSDSTSSSLKRRTLEGSTRGMPVMRASPCYNPLDMKQR